MAGGRFSPRRSTIGLVVVLLVVGATAALVLDVMTTAGARHRASDTPLFDREEVTLVPSRPTAGFRLQPAALRSDHAAEGCVTVIVEGDSGAPSAARLHAAVGVSSADAGPDVPVDDGASGDDGVRLHVSLHDVCPAATDPAARISTDTAAANTPTGRANPRFDDRLTVLIDRHPDFERGLELVAPDAVPTGTAANVDASLERRSIAVVARASVVGKPDLEALAGLTLTVELAPAGQADDGQDGERPVD